MDRLLRAADSLARRERLLWPGVAWRVLPRIILELLQDLLDRRSRVQLCLLVLMLERIFRFALLVKACLGLRALCLGG